MRRVITALLCFLLSLSQIPYILAAEDNHSGIVTEYIFDRMDLDATPIHDDMDESIISGVSGNMFTSNSALAQKLDNVFGGTVSLFSDVSTKYKLGDRLDNSHTYYVARKISGKQCYIYAQAVYYYLFGDIPLHGYGYSGYFNNSKTIIPSNRSSTSYDAMVSDGVGVGAYFRTTSNSDGSYNGDYGHSLIILTYDQTHITFLEGNADGNGYICVTKYTWADFNSKLLTNKGRKISHIVQPLSTQGSVGSYIANCTPYPSYCTLKITDSTCKIKSLPCSVNTDPSSQTVEVPSVGDTYTAVRLYKNTAGNYWYQVNCHNGKTGYLYAGDCSYVSSSFSDLSGSNIGVPSSLTVGSPYPVTGTVSTRYNNISKVSCYIYSGSATSGSAETGSEETVDTKSYNLSRLDANVVYNSLSVGTHNFVVKATTYGYYATAPKTAVKKTNTAIVKQQQFTVGNVSKYYLDINGLLDEENVTNISGYGTCDVYINGSRVADDVSDYYTQWPTGTTYEIKDIRAASGHTYMGVAEGSLSGTVGTNAINIRLSFVTGLPITETPVITSNKKIYKTSETVTLSRNTVANTNYHWIVLYLNNEQILSTSMPNPTYTLNNLSEGQYQVFLQVGNMTGGKTSAPYCFYVENQHYWNSGERIQEPTCQTAGIMRYTCTNCGTTRDESIPKTPHNYTTTVTPPTCTVQGYTTYTCRRCSYSYTKTVEPLGHNYVNGKCSRCGKWDPAMNPFVDVAEGKYYYNPVLWAYYHNPRITSGTDATHFSPNKTCTREQIMTFIWKAYNAPEPKSTSCDFTDVNPKKYYYKAILWAVENKLTGGVGGGKFGVGKPCTREQVVTFLWKAAGSPEPKSTSCDFTDVNPKKYYYKAILWAVENKVTGGMGGGIFGVGKTCTRAQVVTFLHAAVQDSE